jgi:hypothetical protein
MRAYGFAENMERIQSRSRSTTNLVDVFAVTMLDGPQANATWIPLESICNLVTPK